MAKKKKGFHDAAVRRQVKKMQEVEKANKARLKVIQDAVKQVQEDMDYPTRADIFPDEYDWSDDDD